MLLFVAHPRVVSCCSDYAVAAAGRHPVRRRRGDECLLRPRVEPRRFGEVHPSLRRRAADGGTTSIAPPRDASQAALRERTSRLLQLQPALTGSLALPPQEHRLRRPPSRQKSWRCNEKMTGGDARAGWCCKAVFGSLLSIWTNDPRRRQRQQRAHLLRPGGRCCSPSRVQEPSEPFRAIYDIVQQEPGESWLRWAPASSWQNLNQDGILCRMNKILFAKRHVCMLCERWRAAKHSD